MSKVHEVITDAPSSHQHVKENLGLIARTVIIAEGSAEAKIIAAIANRNRQAMTLLGRLVVECGAPWALIESRLKGLFPYLADIPTEDRFEAFAAAVKDLSPSQRGHLVEACRAMPVDAAEDDDALESYEPGKLSQMLSELEAKRGTRKLDPAAARLFVNPATPAAQARAAQAASPTSAPVGLTPEQIAAIDSQTPGAQASSASQAAPQATGSPSHAPNQPPMQDDAQRPIQALPPGELDVAILANARLLPDAPPEPKIDECGGSMEYLRALEAHKAALDEFARRARRAGRI